MHELVRDLCAFATGVVADDNAALFARIARELQLQMFHFRSGDSHNGWLVPDNWRVRRAKLFREGKEIFDGRAHTLGVGRYSKSFSGDMDWAELAPHLVSNPAQPEAYMFHCLWQYRPWDADWALCLPDRIHRTLGPGRYRVELDTEYMPIGGEIALLVLLAGAEGDAQAFRRRARGGRRSRAADRADRAAGVEVQSGLMAGEAAALNCGFLMRMRSGRPWVRLKSAISLDGRTALRNGESRWISSEQSRRDVQHWRARSSAILTGIGTVLADDPRLDARPEGVSEGVAEGGVLQPLRVVADSRWRTPPTSRVLQDPARTLLAGDRERAVPAALQGLGVSCLPLPAPSGCLDHAALLQALANLEINEVQVEAGARLCGALLEAGLVDELLVYQAPVLLGDGGPGLAALGPLDSMAERTHLEVLETTRFGEDLRIRLKPLSTRRQAGACLRHVDPCCCD